MQAPTLPLHEALHLSEALGWATAPAPSASDNAPLDDASASDAAGDEPENAPKRRTGRPKGSVGSGRAAAKAAARAVVRHPRQATVTTRIGTQLTLYQHQQFASREQARIFIRNFALAQGKRVLIDRTASGGSNMVFVCKSSTPCAFKVRVLRSKKKGETAFCITTLETDHGDQCTGRASITKKQVLRDIREASEANTTLTLSGSDAQSIVDRIQGSAGGASAGTGAAAAAAGGTSATHTRVTTQASVMVRTSTDEVMTDAQKVQVLLSQFQAQNPTSSVQVDAYSEHTLRRVFLKLPYATQIQTQSARVLGFESAPLSATSAFGGVTLELVTKDGNDDSVALAVAHCDGMTTENYVWFFNCCLSSGLSLDVPIFCDRSPEVLAAVKSLPVMCLLIQSTKHLLANLLRELQALGKAQMLTPEVRALVLHAQAADTAEEYEATLSTIAAKSPVVGSYLRRVDPDNWAKYSYLRKYPLYGAQCAGLQVAPEHVPVDEADAALRERSLLLLFQSYIEHSMQRIYESRRNAQRWLRSGQLLTRFGERVVLEQRTGVAFCRVSPNDDETGSAYVWDSRNPVPRRRRVNISTNSCTCSFSDQCGLPCKHLAAAVDFFNAGGALWDLGKLCHAIYHARAYIELYGQTTPVSMPLEEELVVQTSIQVVPVGPTNRCSLCHALGHNKRRCPTAAGTGNV